MYDIKITFTGGELVNSMCFASEYDSAVEVNTSETQSQRLDRETRVALDATNKDLPNKCLVIAFLDANSWLCIQSGLPCENKCWSVPLLRSHLKINCISFLKCKMFAQLIAIFNSYMLYITMS